MKMVATLLPCGLPEHHSLATFQGAALRHNGKMTPFVFPFNEWGKKVVTRSKKEWGKKSDKIQKDPKKQKREREIRTFSTNESV